jgi:acetoin:2,6-dichlorophenolindophenol oxidoreductase subunit beta
MLKKNESLLVTYSDAIKQTMIEEAQNDKSIIFFAQGLTDPTGVFGTFKDIEKFVEKDRLIEIPVSENGSVGIAIGSAISGMKPIVTFHRVEFALLAMEQIINNAAKTSFLSAGKENVPIVIRLIIGRGWGQGPNHSQSLEVFFAHIPGLKVIAPTFPKDAKGMMLSAIRDKNPVIILEHRWCHYLQDKIKYNNYLTPLDGPKIIKKGKDFTIVCVSYMSIEALIASSFLEKINISLEIIDLRVLRPLKIDKILKSVNKTKLLMTVDLGYKSFGICSEILATLFCSQKVSLKHTPIRLGMAEKPTPSSRGLIEGHYPNSIDIIREVGKVLQVDKLKLDNIIKSAKLTLPPIDVPNNIFKGPF